MEFLIASAVLELRNSVESSRCPDPRWQRHPKAPGAGARRDRGQSPRPGAILDVVGRALEPVYGFRSLATFKSRFKPDYRTLYLYYQDPCSCPPSAGR